MLLPLDGSALAEDVFPYAVQIAAQLTINPYLLSIAGPGQPNTVNTRRQYIQGAVTRFKEKLEEARQSMDLSTLPVEVSGDAALGTYSPAEEILVQAENRQMDFILMSTHGESGIRRWIIGSITDRVLRSAPMPVWLWRASAPQPEPALHGRWLRHIIVPLDGSTVAEHVLPQVESLAKQRGVDSIEITLLNVAESPDILAGYPEADMELTWQRHVAEKQAWMKREATKYLDGIVERFKRSGITVRKEVLIGKPSESIIDFAGRDREALIAIGTHGQAGSKRWSYGTTTDRVLHAVHNPIFLVRSDDRAT